ncbi:MAG TPA: hypothetical protein VFW33_02010 [Gemmataceae bacterium]|nr:hypothetical protein [Gemmataceae bacterium]
MPTPPGVPDHSVVIPVGELAALEAEEQHLRAFLAEVAEGKPSDRKAPRQMSRIRGATNNLLTAIREALKVLRAPPPDGQPWPDIGA